MIQKNLFKVAKHLLEGPNEGVLPIDKMSADLAQDFSDFFINKIETIRNDITSKSKSNMNNVMLGTDADCSIDCLVDFAPATTSEIKKVIESSPSKSCELDSMPKYNLKNYRPVSKLPFLSKILEKGDKLPHARPFGLKQLP